MECCAQALHRGMQQEDMRQSATMEVMTWHKEKVFPCEDSQALEQGHREGWIFAFGGFKTWMNKALIWTWCWSHFEQQVGLDASWGSFQPELFHDINLDSREHYNGLLKFSMPDHTFQIFIKMQLLLRWDRKHIVWFFFSKEHKTFPSRICNTLKYQNWNFKRF